MQKLPQIKTQNQNQFQNKTKTREENIMSATENTPRTACEVFSRSMGFIRPVSNFNIGKYSEFCERKTFTETNSLTAGQRHSELMKKAA